MHLLGHAILLGSLWIKYPMSDQYRKNVKCILIRLSLLLICIGLCPSISAGEENGWSFLRKYRKDICNAAEELKIDSRVLGGVLVAEIELNKNIIDSAQNLYFKTLVKNKNYEWWRQWHKYWSHQAKLSESMRHMSNKWPAELWMSGYVQSFGPAQITPRTVFRACKSLADQCTLCNNNTKDLMNNLLSIPEAFYLSAAILRFELDEFKKESGENLSTNIDLWATVYNVGGDYFWRSYYSRYKMQPNNFGIWISENIPKIDKILSCLK